MNDTTIEPTTTTAVNESIILSSESTSTSLSPISNNISRPTTHKSDSAYNHIAFDDTVFSPPINNSNNNISLLYSKHNSYSNISDHLNSHSNTTNSNNMSIVIDHQNHIIPSDNNSSNLLDITNNNKIDFIPTDKWLNKYRKQKAVVFYIFKSLLFVCAEELIAMPLNKNKAGRIFFMKCDRVL